MSPTARRRDPQAGITLVEMLVALVIFALIGLASFTTIEAILQVRDRTDGRLERIAQLDRALMVFARDFTAADPKGVRLQEGALSIRDATGDHLRSYRAQENVLRRETGTPQEPVKLAQDLFAPVQDVSFRVLAMDRTWHDIWPSEDQPDQARAVEMSIQIGAARQVRRLVALPGALTQ